MKKLLLIVQSLFFVAILSCLFSCSSDDEPNVEQEEDVLIETPLPADAEPGKVYALSHDRKNGKCVFQFYFSDYSTEELREKYSNVTVYLKTLDSAGNEVSRISLHSYDLDSPWHEMSRDTFEIPCYLCEMIRKFEYSYSYNFDEDGTRQNKYGKETYTQLWRSPHTFFNFN